MTNTLGFGHTIFISTVGIAFL